MHDSPFTIKHYIMKIVLSVEENGPLRKAVSCLTRLPSFRNVSGYVKVPRVFPRETMTDGEVCWHEGKVGGRHSPVHAPCY